MTDFQAPQNSVARFGVAMVGPKFKWAWIEPDTTEGADEGALKVVEGEFHAHPGFGFDDQVVYQRIGALMQAKAVVEQRRVERTIDIVSKADEEGTDPMDALTALADEAVENEQQRWGLLIDQVLMLVAPIDQGRLRPHLEHANPADVRELRDHLVVKVINRAEKAVEAAGGVDPTSPASSAG